MDTSNDQVGAWPGIVRGPAALEIAAFEPSVPDEREILDNDALEAASYDDAPWPDELVELNEARSILRRALDTLGEASREVFVLYELNEMRLKEICEALGLPMGTVASRLRRARQKLARELQALGWLGQDRWRHSGRRWRAL